jgi:hypothetical protein
VPSAGCDRSFDKPYPPRSRHFCRNSAAQPLPRRSAEAWPSSRPRSVALRARLPRGCGLAGPSQLAASRPDHRRHRVRSPRPAGCAREARGAAPGRWPMPYITVIRRWSAHAATRTAGCAPGARQGWPGLARTWRWAMTWAWMCQRDLGGDPHHPGSREARPEMAAITATSGRTSEPGSASGSRPARRPHGVRGHRADLPHDRRDAARQPHIRAPVTTIMNVLSGSASRHG